MQLALVIASLVICLATAMAVYLKNPKSATNIYFALLVSLISIYPVFNYLAINSPSNEQAYFWAKLILLVSVPQGPLLFFFARTYPGTKFVFNKLLQGIILLWVCLNIILAFAGMIFQSVQLDNGAIAIQPGPLVPSFGLLHSTSIIAGLTVLFLKYKRAVRKEKQALALIFYGITFSFTLTFMTTFILPILLKNTFMLALSPIFLTLSVIVVAYAIAKHRLFDIRPIIARSVGYIMSIGLLVAGYATFSSVFSGIFAAKSDSQSVALAINAAIFALGVSIYPRIKRFFDHVTNKLFFRDAYDPQAFLDQLNDTLVGNIEIGILLRHTSMVIEENIKADCHIYVRATETEPDRMIGVNKKEIKPVHLEVINNELATIKDSTVVTDDLPDHYLELKNTLYINDIAVISSLITSYAANQEATAYLMLGHKKSGNAYSKQDIRIINIITDELLIAIQNALRFEEIQNFNVTLQNRINDATSKLKRSNDKLKEMDETKDEFISMASHQLRTPLTSVKGYLSMVLEGDAGKISDNQKQLLNQAYVSSQRMVYLIADLLNVSRLKTGKFVIDKSPTDLAEMVESEIAQLIEVAKSRNLTLTYNKPERFPELELDETKTRQVVMNFVDNAIYYTPSGGKIKIELKTDRSSIYFMVKDNGIGVPKAAQAHLFSKFYRAHNAQKARPDGTGLGLFMAKKVITEQGGAILFESEEGKGSTFGFKFDRPSEKATAKDSDKASGKGADKASEKATAHA